MPRISRAIAVGYPHHITQRGNYRQTVFADVDDYTQYLGWLAQYAPKYGLDIWAYCLMGKNGDSAPIYLSSYHAWNIPSHCDFLSSPQPSFDRQDVSTNLTDGIFASGRIIRPV